MNVTYDRITLNPEVAPEVSCHLNISYKGQQLTNIKEVTLVAANFETMMGDDRYWEMLEDLRENPSGIKYNELVEEDITSNPDGALPYKISEQDDGIYIKIEDVLRMLQHEGQSNVMNTLRSVQVNNL